jgi:hypothetical protein
MPKELAAEPYKDKRMPRFGLAILVGPEVDFSGAVGYADTSEVEFLLAGKGESASETGSFNMLLRNGEHILARYC